MLLYPTLNKFFIIIIIIIISLPSKDDVNELNYRHIFYEKQLFTVGPIPQKPTYVCYVQL